MAEPLTLIRAPMRRTSNRRNWVAQSATDRSRVARINKLDFVTSRANLVPWLAFASALALCLITLIGSIGVLIFLACGGALTVVNWRINFPMLVRFAPLLVFPLLAILSTVWSDAPQPSMRTALQLMLTMFVAILICGNLPLRSLLVAFFLSALVLCCSALPNLPRALESGVPLASSYLGSKNSLGLAAYLLFATALGISFDRGQRATARIVAVIAIPLSLWITYHSRSGGATVSMAMTLVLFPLFAALILFRPRGRTILTGVGLIAFTFALLFREAVQRLISTFRSEVLEKNETLTGRTYLWDVGAQIWAERPILGHGYAAFWRHGNLDAEALWRWGGITARTGFSFHNLFVETKVDLGIVGLAILVVMCGAVVLLSITRQLRTPSVAGAFLLSSLLVLLVRSTIENGLIAQFSSLTLIFVASAVYALAPIAPSPVDSSDRTRARHPTIARGRAQVALAAR